MMCLWAIAEGIGLCAVQKIVQNGVTAAVRQCRFMCCLKRFQEDMDKEEAAVSGLKGVLERKLEEERRNIKTPHMIVQKWTNDTAKAMTDARALREAIEKKKDECCFKNSRCPNCFWQYSLSKQADGLVGTLRDLKTKHNELPPELTYEADIPNIETILDGFMSSNSSKSALDEIMTALQTNDVKMIGLHGMPGVGKSTLAKKVIEDTKKIQLFDECVMITVSRKLNVYAVQYRLAEVLGVTFKEKSSEPQKAGTLMSRIQDRKRKLVVIDNLWEEIDIKVIGIPPIDELENCKILLTTRRVRVCVDMNCQRNIILNTLTEADEWALFRYAANLNNLVATDLAKQVAKACCGLPLAIMSVGKTLKGKTEKNAWKRALEKLGEGEIEDIQDISRETNPYRSIKFSFDELQEKDKRCVLLCALFPRDYGIFVNQLAKYAEELELYQHCTSGESMLSEIIERVEELKNVHFLLRLDIEEERKGIFQMHDLTRDIVRKIGRMHYLAAGDHSRKTVEGYLSNTSFTNIQNMTVDVNSLKGDLKKLSENGYKWKLLCYLYVIDAGIFDDASVAGEDEEIGVMELGGYAHGMGMYPSFEDAMAHFLGAIDEFKLYSLLLPPKRDRCIKFHRACWQ